MDKIIDITKVLEKTQEEKRELDNNKQTFAVQKVTNPILKKLMSFKNDNLSKKFDINDLLR